jgi:enamine deaminase RidA (YjgF/YER057c/UK114 family)
VWIAGSTATSGDQVVARGDMYGQAVHVISKIQVYLARAGARMEDVVQTRAYLTDMSRVAEFARAHREAFGAAPPVNTTVEVSRLAHPDMLVEIEAMAVISGSP